MVARRDGEDRWRRNGDRASLILTFDASKRERWNLIQPTPKSPSGVAERSSLAATWLNESLPGGPSSKPSSVKLIDTAGRHCSKLFECQVKNDEHWVVKEQRIEKTEVEPRGTCTRASNFAFG